MTPEQLEKLVVDGDATRLAEEVATLTEKERCTLSRTAWELRRNLEKEYWKAFEGRMDAGLLPHLAARIKGRTREQLYELVIMAELAVLAVGPLSRARRVRARSFGDASRSAALRKILRDRRPEWLDEWIEETLKEEWPAISWETLRELVKSGAAGKPDSEGYVRLMVQGFPDRWGPRVTDFRPLSRKLLAEPDLLEDELWRLFEVETHAFSLDYGEDNPHAPADYESWTTAVLRLAAEGTIERSRLLDATLSGLATGFKNNTLTGYIKLHEGLKPSLDEKAARQDTYLDLLTNQAGHVVTFALKMLKALEKGKRLDGPGFVESVGRVFDVGTKTQPRTALGLIERVVKREPELTAGAARLAAEALMHESPDVQERALLLLEGWTDRIGPSLVTLLEERAEHVSAAHRGRLEKLVARLGGSATPGRGERHEVEANDLREAELIERAASLAPEARSLAGVDAAVRALENGDPLEPLEFDILETFVLPDARPVEPIADVDELIDAVAHAVEVVDSAAEVERILDGISRLAGDRPDDFERRTAPLVKRIESAGGSESPRGLLLSWGVPRALHCVVMGWLRRTRPKLLPERLRPESGVRRAMSGRLMELTSRVLRGVSAPLLAAPTHAHGWIDPRRLVERLLELQERRLDVPRLDLTQAFLRLAPDHRNQARAEAASVDGKIGRVVRWALGGDETVKRRDRRHFALWVAAGRARAPRERLADLDALGVHEGIPDAVSPAKYSWRAWLESREYDDYRGRRVVAIPRLTLKAEPERLKKVEMAELPCTALHEHASRFSVHDVHSPWLVEWVSMVWPLNQDSVLSAAATAISRRIDMDASSFEPDFAYLLQLLEPARPWSELAVLAEWLGLVSRDADARRAAIDVLVEGIRDGRAHPVPLSRVLVRLDMGGWIKLNRVAGALTEVARVSTLARWVVAGILDVYVASLDSLPRDAHHLLSLLLEVLTELELGPSADARGVLSTVDGSGKTARLAKALLKLEARPGSATERRALLEALEGRVERAERAEGRRACPAR